MVSTAIFVYLLFKWTLLGDMLINGYYFSMSIYGWYVWTRTTDDGSTPESPISKTTKKEQIGRASCRERVEITERAGSDKVEKTRTMRKTSGVGEGGDADDVVCT